MRAIDKLNRPGLMNRFELHLTENKLALRDPFVIGKIFTYADMVM